MKHIFTTVPSVILGQTSADESAGLMQQVDKIGGNQQKSSKLGKKYFLTGVSAKSK